MGEQAHRFMPSLRVSAVIEAEKENRAKAADLVVHPFDLLDDRRWRADQPIVPGAVFRGDIAVGHLGIVLQKLDDADIGQ